MGIRKNQPFGSQPIHVRRPGLVIALQHSCPVIEIIDGNEQDVGFSFVIRIVATFTAPGRNGSKKDQRCEDCDLICFHGAE